MGAFALGTCAWTWAFNVVSCVRALCLFCLFVFCVRVCVCVLPCVVCVFCMCGVCVCVLCVFCVCCVLMGLGGKHLEVREVFDAPSEKPLVF